MPDARRTSAELASAELVARLERLPFSKWHRHFFILAFCGIALDAADFAIFGAALPPWRANSAWDRRRPDYWRQWDWSARFSARCSGARSPTISAAARRSRP